MYLIAQFLLVFSQHITVDHCSGEYHTIYYFSDGEIEDNPGNKRMDRTCKCDLQNGYYKLSSGSCHKKECPIDEELQMNGLCYVGANFQKLKCSFNPLVTEVFCNFSLLKGRRALMGYTCIII